MLHVSHGDAVVASGSSSTTPSPKTTASDLDHDQFDQEHSFVSSKSMNDPKSKSMALTAAAGRPKFEKSFVTPSAIDPQAIAHVTAILASGKLFRYQDVERESEVSRAEVKFAEYLGAKYCLGVSSGGSAMFIALKTILNMNSANPSQILNMNSEAVIEKERDKMVLTNAYTLSPVPGSIVHAGGIPVLVDCTQASGQSISLDDLKRKH